MFNIINYLHNFEVTKEHSTWVEAVCPVCGGRLKIATSGSKAGAYACYTNDCHKQEHNPIRAYLTKDDIKLPSARKYTPRVRKLAKMITPVSLQQIFFANYMSEVSYIQPVVTWSRDGSTKYTSYEYDEFHLTRGDVVNGKKFFFPTYLDEVNTRVPGVPTPLTKVPVYKSNYIQQHVVIAEGEKNADALHKLGVAALTFPGFAFSEDSLPRYVKTLSSVVKEIIYLEDNDAVGVKKRDMVLNAAWAAGIRANSYNLAELLGKQAIPGYDIADAVKDKHIVTAKYLFHVLCLAFDFNNLPATNLE